MAVAEAATAVDPILAGYTAIGLEDLAGAELQRRYDVKTIVARADVGRILDLLRPEYHVLEVAGYRGMDYRTLYLDTDRLDFYRDHHDKRYDRHKVRYRTYVQSATSFFEVKHKSNKGIVQKYRSPVAAWGRADRPDEVDLLRICGLEELTLRPVITVEYERITLVAKRRDERVTIDRGLTAQTKGADWSSPATAILEIKQPRLDRSSPALDALRLLGRRPGPVSKYCSAVASCLPDVKRNRFLPSLRQLQGVT